MSFIRRFVSVLVLAAVLSPAFAQTSQQPSPNQPTPQQQQSKPKCTDTGTYVNSKGETVKRPENCSSTPQGATAQCADGTPHLVPSRARGRSSRVAGAWQ
jgi:hypothetical protein